MSTRLQWYALYTRPKWEKKVAELVAKKGINAYCPLNKVVRQWSDRKKLIHEPLFTSYVFAQSTENDHTILKQVPGVINLVYWLKKPAVIRDVEIEMIQRFLNEHSNIKLEKTPVQINDIVRIVGGPLMNFEGEVIEVKNKTVKLILPSLGYMMSAELETTNVEIIHKQVEMFGNAGNRIAAG